MATQIIILAAGAGKRMSSNLPKVLHSLGGKALLSHVIETAKALSPNVQPIVIYGHEGEQIQSVLHHYAVHWIDQKKQLGTGHAVLQALNAINLKDHVLILYGDVPLITSKTLKKLIKKTSDSALGIVTAELENPEGYGRIKRNQQGEVQCIIEEKDASKDEKKIHEINSGIYFLPATYLKKWLPKLENKNAQKEYYLTDIIAFAVQDKLPIYTIQPEEPCEVQGVNDRKDLAKLERFYQRAYAEKLLCAGVTIYDPARIDIRGDLHVGRDVIIDVGVIFEGKVVLGHQCKIGPYSLLRDVIIGDHVEVKAHSVIEGAEIAANCVIGPFARLRPGTMLDPHVHIGNFVEVKNSEIGASSKINHLSYIGDSEIGKRVNIGAGTITCNYDGANKHKTIIGDDSHIGSDTQLVAPVTVGAGATIGAGSTITKNVPPYQLTLTHKIEQRSFKEWQRPEKKEKKKEGITSK